MTSQVQTRRHSQNISNPGDHGLIGLFASSPVPEINPDTALFQGPDTSVQPCQSGLNCDGSDIPIAHMEIFTVFKLCDGSQGSAINSRSSEHSENQTSLNTQDALKVDDEIAPTADAVSLPPIDLGLRDSDTYSIDLTSSVASSGSFSLSERELGKLFRVFFDQWALITAVPLVDPVVMASQDAENGREISHSQGDDGDDGDLVSLTSSFDVLAFAATSSPPFRETQLEWTSRDLCILERNNLDLETLQESLDDDKSTVESIKNGDRSPTMLHLISHPRVEPSTLSRSFVAPTLCSGNSTYGMPSGALTSNQEIEEDTMGGREPNGSCLARLPSLLSGLGWPSPATDLEWSHDWETLSARSECQGTALGLVTEPQHDGEHDLINGASAHDPARNTSDGPHKAEISHGSNVGPESMAGSPFLEVTIPSTQLIAELSALSPHFSPALLGSTSSDGNLVEPKSVLVQPQLLRVVTTPPVRNPITCAPRTLWPTTSHHHETTQPRDTKRTVSHKGNVNMSNRDHQSNDLNQSRKTRRLRSTDGMKGTRAPLRSAQHAPVPEACPKSLWGMLTATIFELFSTGGETAWEPGSEQLKRELQIETTDRTLVPICEGPITAMTPEP
jgi:hypothetical protein